MLFDALGVLIGTPIRLEFRHATFWDGADDVASRIDQRVRQRETEGQTFFGP